MVLLCCLLHSVTAQTFSAAATIGLTASQVNGDLLAGYNKLGLQGGLKVDINTNSNWIGSVELLYEQRGSRSKLGSGDARKMHLDYLSMPILVGYRDWAQDDYFRMLFEAGLSYGRLFRNEVSLLGIGESVEEFNKNDVSYILGATYYASPRFAYSFRYTNSLNFLLNLPDQPEFGRLRSFYLTFRVLYYL